MPSCSPGESRDAEPAVFSESRVRGMGRRMRRLGGGARHMVSCRWVCWQATFRDAGCIRTFGASAIWPSRSKCGSGAPCVALPEPFVSFRRLTLGRSSRMLASPEAPPAEMTSQTRRARFGKTFPMSGAACWAGTEYPRSRRSARVMMNPSRAFRVAGFFLIRAARQDRAGVVR